MAKRFHAIAVGIEVQTVSQIAQSLKVHRSSVPQSDDLSRDGSRPAWGNGLIDRRFRKDPRVWKSVICRRRVP